MISLPKIRGHAPGSEALRHVCVCILNRNQTDLSPSTWAPPTLLFRIPQLNNLTLPGRKGRFIVEPFQLQECDLLF